MAKEIPIKAEPEEFRNACSDGYVYGICTYYGDKATKKLHVYVELGKEVSLSDRNKSDLFSDRKKFIGCTVYASLTREEVDEGKFIGKLGEDIDVTVMLVDQISN
ncbi:hypothetical protein Pse7367_2015 [Thalassoporum mexicanum PCC 7367]|uniref:hypothetical protein n=1 Tax=Thalassoporum mexicanum TaxID=3457544 RepID=UPI00029FAF47|nr:hypothetical protein [Pseudanabaena sp. PCC 7367]AFY70286.1 hypothetical protein Pse7367_2015 [Pseudanabaena sp. PCC 7367]